MARAGRAFARKTKRDLDSPGLVSMQWRARESSVLGIMGKTRADVKMNRNWSVKYSKNYVLV